jgi:hypothetical protein
MNRNIKITLIILAIILLFSGCVKLNIEVNKELEGEIYNIVDFKISSMNSDKVVFVDYYGTTRVSCYSFPKGFNRNNMDEYMVEIKASVLSGYRIVKFYRKGE